MSIEIRKIKTYYLNPDSFVDRRLRMEKFLLSLGMNYERSISVCNLSLKQNSYSIGSIIMIERAIVNNSYPFLLLDDDVEIVDNLPEKIETPKDYNVMYLGASLFDCGRLPRLKLQEYDNNYYRIFNTLSSHALLIKDRSSAEFVLNVLKKSLLDNEYSDVRMAMESENYIYLTPKDGPYFYQNEPHTSLVTKFLWKDLASSYL